MREVGDPYVCVIRFLLFYVGASLFFFCSEFRREHEYLPYFLSSTRARSKYRCVLFFQSLDECLLKRVEDKRDISCNGVS